MLKSYNPFITAIKRKALSAPMKYLLDNDLLVENILDFGCGRGDDLNYLLGLGYNIAGYDKYNKLYNDDYLLYDLYQTVTCNYVFNVIPDWEEFSDTLEMIRKISIDAYISVRADSKSIGYDWQYDDWAEGYWTGRSFQRFYTIDMIFDHFGQSSQIIKSNNGFILFKLGDE